jgi:hypothetical protein
MEIREIVDYYYNDKSNVIQITFRTNQDSDENIRHDEISLKETVDFGYEFINEDIEYFFDDDYEDVENSSDTELVDYDELISFLNEYYLIYPDRLPESEIY